MGHLGDGKQITTVNDEEVVLTTKEGQNLRMKMADLADVIRQVMSVVTMEKKGLASSRTSIMFLGAVPDCNTASQGIYNIQPSSLNAPIGITGEVAILISLNCYISNAYMFQLCFELLGSKLFFRHKTDSKWWDWKSISFT